MTSDELDLLEDVVEEYEDDKEIDESSGKKKKKKKVKRASIPINDEQLEEIISVMKVGGSRQFRKNILIAEALLAEANLGIRIGDVLDLRPSNFIYINGEIYIDIIEQKTNKPRQFVVNEEYYKHLKGYIDDNKIGPNDRIFPRAERTVQQYLQKVTYYLSYSRVTTHSFRKYCGMKLYEESGHDIILVMKFFQHSSPEITRRYLGITEEVMKTVIQGHVKIA